MLFVVASMVILIERCYVSEVASGWVCVSTPAPGVVCFRNESRIECGPPQFGRR